MNAIKEARYNLGIAYLNDEQYQEAIPEFEAVIQLDPDYIDAHCGLSRAYLELNDLDKAELSTLTALKLNPDYPSVKDLSDSITTTHYENGITLLEGKNYQEAATTFQKVIKLDSNFKDTNYYLGRSFLGLRDYAKAVDSLQSSISSNIIYDDIHYLIGNAFVELKQFQDAIQYLDEAILRNPNQIEAHYYLARAHREFGNLEAATNAAIETQRLDPNYQPVNNLVESIKQTHYNRGISFLKDERFSDAIASLQNVITLDPDYTAAQYNLGIAYLKMENYPRALDNLQKTISLDPRNKEAQHSLALTFLGLAQLDNARNAAKEALSIDTTYQPAKTLLEAIDPTFKADPDDTIIDSQETTPKDTNGKTESKPTGQPRHEAHYATGKAYLDAGKIDEAIGEFQNALDMEPDYVDAHLGLANAYYQNQQLDEAESSVHQVLRIDPNLQDGKQLLDEIERLQNGDSDGESDPQEDIDIDKEFERGLVYLSNRQYQKAASAFKIVLTADPNSVEAYCGLGKTYLEMGEFTQAQSSVQQALRINPKHEQSKKLLKLIKYSVKIVNKKKSKGLIYASVILLFLVLGFVGYEYEVWKWIFQEPDITISASIVEEPKNSDGLITPEETVHIILEIENKGGTAKNTKVNIDPKYIRGLKFSDPTLPIDIRKNYPETVEIKIHATNDLKSQTTDLTIQLVDEDKVNLATTFCTLRIFDIRPED
ncbi:hypothetical protein C6497_14335 [Candidatus Poribacteria bacterium]|nr:MAG: hypothetical protein C6497_14335 [Candidatus Poribacteria bacterium]